MKIKLTVVALLFLTSSCFIFKKNTVEQPADDDIVINLDEIAIPEKDIEPEIKTNKIVSLPYYNASETKVNDLIHTELDLKFDYAKRHVLGLAKLTLSPHYYKVDSVVIDARGFDIHKISLLKNGMKKNLNFKYNEAQITIKLDKVYSRDEKFTIEIDYTAKPNELKKQGSWAIHDDRGLYFIDADSDHPQIWSQGETESNSCWFPTIDSPNQKTTQDIFLTVKREYKTLSNGVLYNSLLNDDGTRTDHWRQEKPHAPYLIMIAVGKYEVIENYWRDMEVFTYATAENVEKTKELVKNTPEMIEFYSRLFDVDYPWDKYSQIVVKDFISGAMENTSATVLGEYLINSKTRNARIDHESTVAHELSHHWFGDLVTCESWANLPLNESFATYSEYLWLEHKYGRFEADAHLLDNAQDYFFSANYNDKNMIRFHYKHRDDMFDVNSYQKGGTILHMLRYQVGDEAFFDALELYLKKNMFKSAEIHDLRLAFEEITGKDMNPFFNQWFLSKGYPKFEVKYSYNSAKKISKIEVEQKQDLNENPLYQIPMKIDLYFNNEVVRKEIYIDSLKNTFTFKVKEKPILINFNADNSVLCKYNDNKTEEEYHVLLDKAPLFFDKTLAFSYFYENKKLSEINESLLNLMKHSSYNLRFAGLELNTIEKGDVLWGKYKLQLEYMQKHETEKAILDFIEDELK